MKAVGDKIMAESTPNEKIAQTLRDQASNLANLVPETLARRELGQANFDVLLDDFKAMQAIAKRMANCS